MATDINTCGVDRFREIVDAQKENLKYLRQFEATAGAFKAEQYSKFKALVIGLVGEAYKDKAEAILGDTLSFEALVGALQLLSIVNPAALGTSLERELGVLESYFEFEKARLDAVIDYIDYLIDKLAEEWNDIDDAASFQANFRRHLNTMYNADMPAALRHVMRAKTGLIGAQNMVINGNVFTDDEASFLGYIVGAQNSLGAARNALEDDDNPSLLELLLQFTSEWEALKRQLNQLRRTDSPDWFRVRTRFEEVGENYRSFLKAFYVALNTLVQSIGMLNTTEADMREAWKAVHRNLVLNQDFSPGNLSVALYFYAAIDNYLLSETPGRVMVPPPLVGGTVDQTSIAEWERQANVYRSFKTDWIRDIQEVRGLLDRITTPPTSTALGSVETIYTPITNAVIDTYEATVDPVWGRLASVVASIDNIFFRVIQARQVSGTFSAQLANLKLQATAIRDAVNLSLGYFSTNDPRGALQSALGLSQTTSAVLSGFEAFSDTLGLDYLSNLVSSGDLTEVFKLDEESANTVGQLVQCLSAVEEAGDVAKGYAAEIRRIAAGELERKRKLRQTTETFITNAVRSQESQIAEREELLTRFENALG